MKKPARSLACGIVTVSLLGIGLSVGIAGPAGATPAKAPSWADVQAAKADQAETQQTVDELASRLSSLQDGADQAGIVVQQAGQTYALAASEQQEAQSTLDDLGAQSKRAKASADESAGQVAALVVELSRSGGGDLSTSMLVDASDAKDLLYQVGTMTHLSERSASVLAQAQADQKTVDSLAAQKRQATKALAKAAATTKTSLEAANDTAAKANGALADAQSQQNEVLEQLAFLKGSTVAAESAYYTEQHAQQAEAQLAAAASGATTTTPSGSGTATTPNTGTTAPNTGTTTPNTGTSTPSKPATTPVAPAKPSTPATTPVAPAKPSTPAAPAPAPAPPPAPAPSSPSKAAGAIAYARAQLGKPYLMGGAGPSTWDCSGLVMMAYSSQGIATGGHNVVWQYNYFKSIGRLVPMSQRQPGDILFYSSNGTASGGYHDSIYTGGGRMVEAARPGVGVVERAVWLPNQLLPYVARPSGSL